MRQKTHARRGDTSSVSSISVTLYYDKHAHHLAIRTTTDPDGMFDAANPRFSPLARGGQSFEVWLALVSCCLSFEKNSTDRAVLKGSQGNLFTLRCMGNGDIVAGTETNNEQQGAEVIIENDHPYASQVLKLFEALGEANVRNPSKGVVT